MSNGCPAQEATRFAALYLDRVGLACFLQSWDRHSWILMAKSDLQSWLPERTKRRFECASDLWSVH